MVNAVPNLLKASLRRKLPLVFPYVLSVKDRHELYDTIFSSTTKIQEEFPELVKYLGEIPEHFSPASRKGVNNQELQDYSESLNRLLTTYAKEH